MFCQNCGSQVNVGDIVCSKCGGRLNPVQRDTSGFSKTSLGIRVNVQAAIIFFTALLGGYVALFLIAGYTLLKEKNEWLKKNAIKAVWLSIIFSVSAALIGLIPDTFNILTKLIGVSSPIMTDMCNIVGLVILWVKKIVLFLSGYMAFKCMEIRVSFIDKMIQ